MGLARPGLVGSPVLADLLGRLGRGGAHLVGRTTDTVACAVEGIGEGKDTVGNPEDDLWTGGMAEDSDEVAGEVESRIEIEVAGSLVAGVGEGDLEVAGVRAGAGEGVGEVELTAEVGP